ncbi:MAG: DUF559 domain-containing protein, partial [Reyranellaceae bacterium]
MTDAERRVWFALRDRRFAGRKFRRQSPFDQYVLDFVCFADLDLGLIDRRTKTLRRSRAGRPARSAASQEQIIETVRHVS